MRNSLRIIAVATALPSCPLWACTLCHSRIAEEVRAIVLAHDFWSNIAALLLPFPIFGAAILFVRRIAP